MSLWGKQVSLKIFYCGNCDFSRELNSIVIRTLEEWKVKRLIRDKHTSIEFTIKTLYSLNS